MRRDHQAKSFAFKTAGISYTLMNMHSTHKSNNTLSSHLLNRFPLHPQQTPASPQP